MLRITVHNDSQGLTFQLEGRLTSPWLDELADCWHRMLLNHPNSNIRFDLNGLTFIDHDGKKYLESMHRLGAELFGADCETQSIIDEITGSSSSCQKANNPR